MKRRVLALPSESLESRCRVDLDRRFERPEPRRECERPFAVSRVDRDVGVRQVQNGDVVGVVFVEFAHGERDGLITRGQSADRDETGVVLRHPVRRGAVTLSRTGTSACNNQEHARARTENLKSDLFHVGIPVQKLGYRRRSGPTHHSMLYVRPRLALQIFDRYFRVLRSTKTTEHAGITDKYDQWGEIGIRALPPSKLFAGPEPPQRRDEVGEVHSAVAVEVADCDGIGEEPNFSFWERPETVLRHCTAARRRVCPPPRAPTGRRRRGVCLCPSSSHLKLSVWAMPSAVAHTTQRIQDRLS